MYVQVFENSEDDFLWEVAQGNGRSHRTSPHGFAGNSTYIWDYAGASSGQGWGQSERLLFALRLFRKQLQMLETMLEEVLLFTTSFLKSSPSGLLFIQVRDYNNRRGPR